MIRRLGGATQEIRDAVGSWPDITRKGRAVRYTLVNLLAFRQRKLRLLRLQQEGRIAEIPSDWQIIQASYVMMTEFIIPSNDEFYEHYSKNMYWLQFLRFLDEPSVFMDPAGLAIPSDVLIRHLLHVVHTSAGYDVELLETFPGALQELELQLELLVEGRHLEQEALEALLEREDYPQRLLEALKRYRENPIEQWQVITYETPPGCEALFDDGIERFGSVGRLLGHAATLPRTPLDSVRRWLSPGRFAPV
jgi:hypothetical protein